MRGVSGFVKLVVTILVIFAAVTGTEAVDVLEVADDLTVKAQSYFNDVDIDGDETELFDESIESQEFARPASKVPTGVAFEDTSKQDAGDALVDDEADS